jgi:putative DNA primase/helicase
LIFGGAPKVGKSDFLISWLVYMAEGKHFLGMQPANPLKIFYLQTEIGYHYLRERLKQLELDPDVLEQISNNLVITPQTRMLLNDEGIA